MSNKRVRTQDMDEEDEDDVLDPVVITDAAARDGDGGDEDEDEQKAHDEEEDDIEEVKEVASPPRPLFNQLFTYGSMEVVGTELEFWDCILEEHLPPFSSGDRVDCIIVQLLSGEMHVCPKSLETTIYSYDLAIGAIPQADDFHTVPPPEQVSDDEIENQSDSE